MCGCMYCMYVCKCVLVFVYEYVVPGIPSTAIEVQCKSTCLILCLSSLFGLSSVTSPISKVRNLTPYKSYIFKCR